jgi:hypothetical protein
VCSNDERRQHQKAQNQGGYCSGKAGDGSAKKGRNLQHRIA